MPWVNLNPHGSPVLGVAPGAGRMWVGGWSTHTRSPSDGLCEDGGTGVFFRRTHWEVAFVAVLVGFTSVCLVNPPTTLQMRK